MCRLRGVTAQTGIKAVKSDHRLPRQKTLLLKKNLNDILPKWEMWDS